MKKFGYVLAVALLLAIPVQDSFAAGTEFGVRAGYSFKPDQFVVGGQAVFGAPFKNARYAVSADAGFGDDFTTVLLNLDLRFIDVAFPGSSSGFYFGGGPALAFYDHELFSDTEIGVNLVAGLNLPLGSSNAYNLEARLGFGDMPDFRILLGIMLGGRK